VQQPQGKVNVSWIERIFTSGTKASDLPSPSTGFYDIEGQPVPLSLADQDVRAARELIRSAAVRTTAAFGIPSNWLSYEVVTISDDEKAYFQLQVSLRIWDEQLWAQSSAYERQVLVRIREADSNVVRAVRAVLWRVLPDAGCPHDELSGAAAWRAEAIRARGEIYDRTRRQLALAAQPAAPAINVPGFEITTTLPPSLGVDTNFKETVPVHSDFDETKPTAPVHP
jgi:hypothetical protein